MNNNLDYKSIIKQKEYDYLRTNEHLGSNIMLLVLSGSHAYGTNIETSDIDIRGCAYNKPQELLGFSEFEQFIDKKTDTTIYSFRKLIQLLCNCNPNIIEMLGCLPEHYILLSEQGRQLIENRKMFLSKKAAYTFGGYANEQLKRLQNALVRDGFSPDEKEKHILATLIRMLENIKYRYKDIKVFFDKKFLDNSVSKDKNKKEIYNIPNCIYLYIDKSENKEMYNEIYLCAKFNGYPLRDFKNVVADMGNIIKNFESINHRNKKKDNMHLNKHAMHLVRLLLTAIDIFEKEEIVTYRKNEHDLLMSIRNGAFQKEDRGFHPEFFEMVDGYKKELDYAVKNSSLPELPDYKKIEEFAMEINKYSILKTMNQSQYPT
jgi:predicted nucleotidyltransferase